MTETSKWRDQWFRDLSTDAKLLWLYICDNCDCAGFWTIDVALASFETGMPAAKIVKALESFADAVNMKDGIIWLIRFLEVQKNLPLSESCPPHKPIISRLEMMKAFHPNIEAVLRGERPVKGLDTLGEGFQYPLGKSKSKGNSKSKSKVDANTPMMIRIGAWFGRLPNTLWTVDEAERLAALGDAPPQIEIVEEFHKAKHPKDADYRRRDIQTLLNNWNAEIDKATRWKGTAAKPRPVLVNDGKWKADGEE